MPGDVVGYYAAAGQGVLETSNDGPKDYTVDTVTSTTETTVHNALTIAANRVMVRAIASKPSLVSISS